MNAITRGPAFLRPPVARVICAWCVTFDRTAPANKGASHTICAACLARLEAWEAAQEAAR